MKIIYKYFTLLIFIHIVVAFTTETHSQEIRTIFYDRNYEKVSGEVFADYILYTEVDSITLSCRFRLNRTGGITIMEGKANKIDFDKFDNSDFLTFRMFYDNGLVAKEKCIFDDKVVVVSYHHNGQPNTYTEYNLNNEIHGFYSENTENGTLVRMGYMDKGKFTGENWQIQNDGSYVFAEYSEGIPTKSYYSYMSPDGYVTHLKWNDHKPLSDTPTINNIHNIQTKDGTRWWGYQMNGITIYVTPSLIDDYGKYYQLKIMLYNHTPYTLDFNPKNISASIETKKGDINNMFVMSAEEYLKRVNRTLMWESALNALAEGLNANSAGYSYSKSVSTGNVSGGSLTATANNSGRTAVSTSLIAGSYSNTTATISYDGFAAYQAKLIAQQRIAEYNKMQLDIKQTKQCQYLKSTQLEPGESVIGVVNIKHQKGCNIKIKIPTRWLN